MKIAVIGANGFLGSNLVLKLYGHHDLLLIDRRISSNDFTDSIYLESDFNNKLVYKALEGFDIVYFCAGHTDILRTWNDSMLEIEDTIAPQFMFFNNMSELGVKKVVFPSSGGTIYGDKLTSSCESDLLNPNNPYAIGKAIIEFYLEYLRCKNGMNYDVYRLANVYGNKGEKGAKQGVIPVWINCILNGEKVILYGDGEKRDYVYIDDVTHLMMYSTRNLYESDVFNVGTGVGTSLMELLYIFKEIVGYDFPIEIREKREFDSQYSVLDSSKILRHFSGFKFSDLKEKISDLWRGQYVL